MHDNALCIIFLIGQLLYNSIIFIYLYSAYVRVCKIMWHRVEKERKK